MRFFLGVTCTWVVFAALVDVPLAAQSSAPLDVAAQTRERVGVYGDPGRLTILATRPFAPEAIRRKLQADLDVLLAAHPFAPLDAYLDTVQAKVAAGYRHAGFAAPQVTIRLDRDIIRVEVHVKQGPRYTAGKVQLNGTRAIESGDFVERMTLPYPPADAVAESFAQHEGKTEVQWVDKEGKKVSLKDPLWKRGDPAPFDRVTRAKLQERAKLAFAELGHFFPKFEIDVVADSDGNTARLMVNVRDEGPKALVDKIEVVGHKDNTREEILDYLELRPGEILTRQKCTRMQQKLWRSGRFVESRVEPVEPAQPQDPVVLQVELKEYSKAPRLSEPFSPEEQGLLKLRDWLARSDRWQSDLVMQATVDGYALELVLSPGRGSLLSARSEAGAAENVPIDAALVVSNERAAVYSFLRRRKLSAAPVGQEFIGSVTLRLVEEPDDPDRPYAFTAMLGLGVTSRDEDAGNPPFRVVADLAPVAFVATAHERDAKCTLRDGVLRVSAREPDAEYEQRWTIDVGTGRLLEMAVFDDGETEPAARVTFDRGRFNRRLAEIDSVTAGFPNDFDGRRPVSSTLGFLAGEVAVWALPESDVEARSDPQLARLFEKLLLGDVLEPLDRIFVVDENSEPQFTIPTKSDVSIEIAAARLVLVSADAVFPRYSWPWTMGRETALGFVGGGKYLESELERLYTSDESGPVCCLVCGLLAERFSPIAAQMFASKGLLRLSPEDFRNDYRFLLHGDSLCGQCVQRAAKVLRTLDEKEVRLVEKALAGTDAGLLMPWVRRLRRQPSKPVDKVLPGSLDHLWTSGLRQRVESALHDLRERNAVEGTLGNATPITPHCPLPTTSLPPS